MTNYLIILILCSIKIYNIPGNKQCKAIENENQKPSSPCIHQSDSLHPIFTEINAILFGRKTYKTHWLNTIHLVNILKDSCRHLLLINNLLYPIYLDIDIQIKSKTATRSLSIYSFIILLKAILLIQKERL